MIFNGHNLYRISLFLVTKITVNSLISNLGKITFKTTYNLTSTNFNYKSAWFDLWKIMYAEKSQKKNNALNVRLYLKFQKFSGS